MAYSVSRLLVRTSPPSSRDFSVAFSCPQVVVAVVSLSYVFVCSLFSLFIVLVCHCVAPWAD